MKKLIFILSGVALMILFTPIYTFSQSNNEAGKAKTTLTKNDAKNTDCTKTCPEAKTCKPNSKTTCKSGTKACSSKAKTCCSKGQTKDGKKCDPAKCPEAKNCNPANCKSGNTSCSKSCKDKEKK